MRNYAYAMTTDDWKEIGRVAYPWLIVLALIGAWVTVDNLRNGKPKPPPHGTPVVQSPSVDVQASRVP